MDVDRMIDELIEREGDYVNHPADKGGPTRYGITEGVARAHGARIATSPDPEKTDFATFVGPKTEVVDTVTQPRLAFPALSVDGDRQGHLVGAVNDPREQGCSYVPPAHPPTPGAPREDDAASPP